MLLVHVLNLLLIFSSALHGPSLDAIYSSLVVKGSQSPRPLNITCIAVGSRGDVQPYIALAKGLQKHGHRVKIVTHQEFKEWVESHGIIWSYLAGEPAKIMEKIVVSGQIEFVRWSLTWFDELLSSVWEASQDSELIIDSPASMGGLHVAQKLEIPYFRHMPFLW